MASGFDSAEFGDARRIPATPRPAPISPAAEGAPQPVTRESEWATVKEASTATGVPQSTLRGWYRRDRVTSRTAQGPSGPRIELLTRDVEAMAAHRRATGPTDSIRAAHGESAPQETPAGVLVPLDSWQQLLRQLGNLHEAGRDLAEARERAARAETEAVFLRERLAELRDRLAAAETPAAPPATPRPSAAPPSGVAPPTTPPAPGRAPVNRAAGMRLVTKVGRSLIGSRRRRR